MVWTLRLEGKDSTKWSATIGNYTQAEIRDKIIREVGSQCEEEGRKDVSGKEYWERVRELESKPIKYPKCMILIYNGPLNVVFDNLRTEINRIIPDDMKDSIKVEIHYDRLAPFIGRVRAIPAPRDGIEIMATEDVELGMRFE